MKKPNQTNNLLILNYLDQLSKYYSALKDYGRYTYYYNLNLKLKSLNLNNDDFLSSVSSEKTYKVAYQDLELMLDQTRDKKTRLETLEEQNKWLKDLDLLSTNLTLDIESLQSSTPQNSVDLDINSQIDNITRQLELKYYNTVSNPTSYTTENPIGVVIGKTKQAGGDLDLELEVPLLKSQGIKHIFVLDQYESTNTFLGLNKERFTRRKKILDKLQVENQVKIFQGIIIDVDLSGSPCVEAEILAQLDFVVIDIKTKPFYSTLERVQAAINKLDILKHKIMIDLSNKAYYLVDRIQLEKLVVDNSLILKLDFSSRQNSLLNFDLLNQNKKIRKIIGFLNQSETLSSLEQFKMVSANYNLKDNNCINFFPRPFALTQTKNLITIKDGNVVENLDETRDNPYLKKIEALKKAFDIK